MRREEGVIEGPDGIDRDCVILVSETPEEAWLMVRAVDWLRIDISLRGSFLRGEIDYNDGGDQAEVSYYLDKQRLGKARSLFRRLKRDGVGVPVELTE